MIFYSFFKTLVGKQVTVELKNDLAITGVLHSVDQYLNIKLTEISVGEPERHPQASFFFRFSFSSFLRSSSSCFLLSGSRQERHPIKTPHGNPSTTAGDGQERVHPRVGGTIRQGKERGEEFGFFFSSFSFSFRLFSTSTSSSCSHAFSPSLHLSLFLLLNLHQLPTDGVDTELLHDATRREARGQ
jgi:small nuclear ribonucleoprotein (snRNP)-like protein